MILLTYLWDVRQSIKLASYYWRGLGARERKLADKIVEPQSDTYIVFSASYEWK